jgi:hypothetical protein
MYTALLCASWTLPFIFTTSIKMSDTQSYPLNPYSIHENWAHSIFNLLKPNGYVMHQQFNIQQL